MQIAAQAVRRHANLLKVAAKTGMQIIDRLPLGEMRQKIADLLARDLLGQAVRI